MRFLGWGIIASQRTRQVIYYFSNLIVDSSETLLQIVVHQPKRTLTC